MRDLIIDDISGSLSLYEVKLKDRLKEPFSNGDLHDLIKEISNFHSSLELAAQRINSQFYKALNLLPDSDNKSCRTGNEELGERKDINLIRG